jgi:acyl-CoA dehydrogenase
MDLAPPGEPFLEEEHRQLRSRARELAIDELEALDDQAEEGVDLAKLSRRAIARMTDAGLLEHAVPRSHGGARSVVSVRELVAIREGLAFGSGLADALFALQGLGSLPITLAGSDDQREAWLPRVATGDAIMGFAMTEPEAGSNAADLATSAEDTGQGWRLNGTKTYISNAGIADAYALFARTADTGKRGITCFLVPGDADGLSVDEQNPMAAHPLGQLHLDGVQLSPDAVIGDENEGYKLALATLGRMRATVAAAACGFAWRALHEAIQRARSREQFDQPVAGFQGLRWNIADAATRLEASRLLTYQAAWRKDEQAKRVTRESAQAKVHATETAQECADLCVQVHGGEGVMQGTIAERLYRDVRAPRIYEGASEVLRDVVGKQVIGALEG